MEFQKIIDRIVSWATGTGIKLLISVVILIVSFKLINYFDKKLSQYLSKKEIVKTAIKPIRYISRTVLKGIILMLLLEYLGISTASIAALMASLGVGIGLAVQGTVANIAGGVMLIITRPFRTDDWIEVGDVSGSVETIHLTYTYIKTIDTKIVAIPNGTLANSRIVNYTAMPERQYDLLFSISYSSDYRRAEKIITEIFESNEKILKDRPMLVRMKSHGASAIEIVARAWVKTGDYWDEYWNIMERVKDRFDEEGIEIPFNQLDVHLDGGLEKDQNG